MKAHIGVDAESGRGHTVTTTPANRADVTQISQLLHGKEKTAHGDAGCMGADKRARKRGRTWRIAAKRASVGALPEGEWKATTKHLKYLKAAVRAKVEHPCRVIKRQFGYLKVRCRGLAKNTAQMFTLYALSHLWMARRRLLGWDDVRNARKAQIGEDNRR